MVDFCGWDMPVQYAGVLPEHKHTRANASLFDVSHMCQLEFHGKDRDAFLETLVVGDVSGMAPGQQLYSLFTSEDGGIIDDTVITKFADVLYVVVNAGCADKDKAHIQQHAERFRASGGDVTVVERSEHSLLALQGPKAHEVLARFVNVDLSRMDFFRSDACMRVADFDAIVGRQGYTGEDGFELSIPTTHVAAFAQSLLDQPEVKWAGLGARDSLRLEAGLTLYGNDIDESTSPIEAALAWTIPKSRRGPDATFLGATKILAQLKSGVKRRRVGLKVQGPPARQHTMVYENREGGDAIGEMTSGTFAPTLGYPIGMAYVPKALAKAGTELFVEVRGRRVPASVVKMPFVPTKYYKSSA